LESVKIEDFKGEKMLHVLFNNGHTQELQGEISFADSFYDIDVDGYESRDYDNFKLIFDDETKQGVKFHLQCMGFFNEVEYGKKLEESLKELKQIQACKNVINTCDHYFNFNNKNTLSQWLVFNRDEILEALR
jgi:hypothetical protein